MLLTVLLARVDLAGSFCGVDYLIIDEFALISRITYEQYLRPTLADREGWALFCSTPRGFNHAYDYYKYGKSEEFPEWASWRFPSTESPYFKDDLNELKRTLTKETFRQEILCEFQAYQGRVLPVDRFQTVRKDVKYDSSRPVYAGVDPGYRQSHVVICQLHNETDRFADIHQIDEISLTNSTTQQLADAMKAKPYHYTAIFGDPAGSGTNLHSGRSDWQLFSENNLKVTIKRDAVTRNVVSGVSHMRTWFEDADGRAHIFLNPSCKESLSSYENYHYPEHKAEQSLKHEPVKDGREHACDALRFMIVNLFPMRNNKAGMVDFV